LKQPSLENGMPWIIQGTQVGLLPPSTVQHLLKADCKDTFIIHQDPQSFYVELNPALNTIESRTLAMSNFLKKSKETGVFPRLQKGWRNELFPIYGKTQQGLLLNIERAAAGIFGFRTYSCHLNGYVRRGGDTKLWVARRSANKPTYPLKLDSLAAGGISSSLKPFQTLQKEAFEESGVSTDLSKRAIPTGFISFYLDVGWGWFPHTQFAYDLELPADFQPNARDGEVDSFKLLSLKEVSVLKILLFTGHALMRFRSNVCCAMKNSHPTAA
jgi:8-oxo-dGTP pyrophosphatase MutT (NUDIX family)